MPGAAGYPTESHAFEWLVDVIGMVLDIKLTRDVLLDVGLS